MGSGIGNGELIGPRSKNAISFGLAESVKSITDRPPWYHACDEDVAPGHRDERRVVGDAVLVDGLRHRQLVVAAELHLPVDDVEDRVGAPLRLVGRRGSGRAVPPPHSSVKITLVPSLLNVAECQYEKFGSDDRVEPHRVHRVGDVEQDAVALAGAGRQTELAGRP